MVGGDFRISLRRLCRAHRRYLKPRGRRRRFRRARRRDMGRARYRRSDGGGDAGLAGMKAAVLALLGLAAAGQAALAFDPNSPMLEAPLTRQIGPDAPRKPKSGDPPGDLAFGAYQRGYYLTALREAEKRLSANPRDAPAMTLIGEIYHDGLAVP